MGKKVTVYDVIDLLETSIVGIPCYADAVRGIKDFTKSLKDKYAEVSDMDEKPEPTPAELEEAKKHIEAAEAAAKAGDVVSLKSIADELATIKAELAEIKAAKNTEEMTKVLKDLDNFLKTAPVKNEGLVDAKKELDAGSAEVPVYKRGETNDIEFFRATARATMKACPGLFNR